MDARASSLEEFLRALLRGAAKILGCGSTNLILINDRSQEIRIRLGTMAVSNPIVSEIEQMMGSALHDFSIPIREAADSLVLRSWREGAILETASLAELVGRAMSPSIVDQLARMAANLRFLCVPALSLTRCYGVLLFQKEGTQPFSRQQRELVLRYARRIGTILEGDLTGEGPQLFSRLRAGPDYLLFARDGELRGSATAAGAVLDPTLVRAVGNRVRDAAAVGLPSDGAALPGGLVLPQRAVGAGASVELIPFTLDGEPVVFGVVHGGGAERSLSFESQLLELTLGDVAPALFVDPDLRITSGNQAVEALLGCGQETLVGRSLLELLSRPSELRGPLSAMPADAPLLQAEEPATLVRADGSLVSVRLESLPLAGDRHEAVGFLVVLRDASADRADPTDRLVRQERLATMGEMAAQIAHEIRNPLVAIGATLETVINDPMLDESHRAILGTVNKEIVRMDMILRDHLAFGHEPSCTSMELGSVVADARLLLEGAARRAGKTIATRVPAGLWICADYESMKHLLFNLLHNALDATPAGTEVLCTARLGDHDVTVEVVDQGPGLAASPAECLQPFFTTKANGTGLGLAVCQRIARAHGGVLEIGNAPGGGCRAAVLLPREPSVWSERR